MSPARHRGSGTPALLFGAGAFALVAQSLLLREHLVLGGGDALALGVFFAAWLGWVAAGAGVLRRRAGLREKLARHFPWLLLAYGPALLLQLLLLRWLPVLLATESFAALPIPHLLAAGLLVDAPLCFLTGLLFPAGAVLSARGEKSPTRTVATLYAVEAAGAGAGGLAVTALTAAALPALGIALGATMALAVLVAVVAGRGGALRPATVALLLAVSAGSLALSPAGNALLRATDAARDARLLAGTRRLAAVESPYQHAAVFQRGGLRLLTLDGQLAASLPDPERAERSFALLLSQRPRPARVLIVGVAGLALAERLLETDVAQLTLLAPGDARDEHVLALIRGELLPPDSPLRRDERFALRSLEARRFIADCAAGAWDLVVVDLPAPDSPGGGRLATQESFAALRRCLAPEALLAFRARSARNALSPAQAAYGGSLLATLESVFDQVLVLPGEESWFLASPRAGSLLREPEALARRYAAEAFDPSRVGPALLSSLVEPGRMREAQAAFRAARGDGPERDGRRVAFFHNLLIEAEAHAPAVADALRALQGAGPWLVLLPLLLGLGLRARRVVAQAPPLAARQRWNGAAIAAALGGAAIALQLVLLLRFESRVGSMFWLAGLLNALFMAGLAGGSAAGAALARRSAQPARLAGLATLAALLTALGLPMLLELAGHGGAASHAALALTLGAALGFGIPAALRLAEGPQDAGALGASLTLAEHAGAALGAALTGLLLVPLVGLDGSCRLAAAVLALPLVLLAGEWLAARLASHPIPALEAWRGRRRQPSLPWAGLGYALLFVAGSAAGLGALAHRHLEAPRRVVAPAELLALAPAARAENRDEPFPHTLAWEEGAAAPVAAGATSAAGAPEVEGYGGPLNVLTVVAPGGRLLAARVLASRESPAYLHGLDDWLAGLRGRELATLEELDALTGATVTSRALLSALGRTGRALAGAVYGERLPEPPPAARSWPAALWVLLAALLLAIPVSLRGGAWTRRAFLLTSLVLGGFAFNAVLSTEHVAALAQGRLPGAGDPVAWLLVVGALGLGLLLGPLYCSLLCPLGAAQELIGDAARARPPTANLYRRVRFLKYAILAVVVVAGALGLRPLAEADPLVRAFALDYSAPAAALLLAILAASAVFPRLWCRTLCPVGALLQLTNGLALLRGLRRPRYPARCDMGTTRAHDLDCLQCDRCLRL